MKTSTFTKCVREAVRQIPKGQTRTYGEVAKATGRPGAARAVGVIMANNQDKTVPCHRVILSNGKIGAYNRLRGPSKRALLIKEGVKGI